MIGNPAGTDHPSKGGTYEEGVPRRGAPTARLRVSLCAVAIALLAPSAAQAAKPAYLKGHPYRHGAVPFRGHPKVPGAPQVAAASAGNLKFQGASTGAGVTTGAEKVSLVFWGSQWGTQGTNGSGYETFTGDSSGVAPDLQAFFTGIGTGGETWSGVMTQYCNGVSTGAQTCPATNTQHVGYPSGGGLAGVWEDTSAAAPAAASGHAIGAEAVKAATHFGNTTQASNTNAQYVIVFPHGTNPDNYKTQGFCAWHDYTGDSTRRRSPTCGRPADGSIQAAPRTATNAPGSPPARVLRRTCR